MRSNGFLFRAHHVLCFLLLLCCILFDFIGPPLQFGRETKNTIGVDPIKLADELNKANKQKGFFNGERRSAKSMSSGRLVSTAEEFRALRDEMADKPYGAAVCFIQALLNYCSEDPDVHEQGNGMVTLCLWEESLVSDGGGYMGFSIHRSDEDRLRRMAPPKEYIVRSYVSGTSPENGYEFDPSNITIAIRPQKEHAGSEREGWVKVFIWSSGADTARPITLKKNSKGVWKVSEFSSLTVDIRPPVPPGPTAADVL